MEKLDILELLKEHTREEVKQIMVDAGIARDLPHAEFIIAISLGEIQGDRIELDDDEAE